MADRVLVPLPDGRWLALEPEVFTEALDHGSRLIAAPARAPAPQNEPLVGSEELAKVFDVPVSWIDAKAREGVIPSLEFGRWRRFKRSDVEAAVRKLRETQ